MEPNNIEKQFREKLNQREIKPSENSWDRLDAMLTVAEKPKRNYRWMYFAASFLGFILIATVFLSQTEDAIDVPNQKVVIEQYKVENNENTLEEVLDIPTGNAVQVVSTTETIVEKKLLKSNPQPKSSFRINEKPSSQTALASNDPVISSPIITREQSSSWRSNQKTNVTVDVNALLASVDSDKPMASIASITTPVKINSSDLLSQVDNELELSFREKVIQSVNKKYKEVKVAVTNRNLE